MALFGSLAAVRDQIAGPERFAPAFACVAACLKEGAPVRGRLLALAAGATERIELAGGSFALLQAYLTGPALQSRWETHRAYIDVQAAVAGEEFMGAADADRLEVDEDLTPVRDAVFYRPFGGGSALRMGSGSVAVFYPADAHRGGISVSAPALVRKVVVKVPVADVPSAA